MSKYSTDKPVNKKDEDFFQRYEFSKRIAESIKSHKNPDCVVFGVSGVWGEGKTSVLNFIEKELLSSYPKIICLRFNPWRYNDENILLTSLFNSLAQKIKESIKSNREKKGFFRRAVLVKNEDDPLKKEIETIGELLQEYGEIASVFGMGGLVKSIGEGLSSVDVEKRKERIEKILEKLERRIVIFIDDIDRLDKNEIYSLLKIVKLTGDFKYMTYILSFDENMVASAISGRFGEGDEKAGHNFLEKIIQVPLKIPKAQKTSLKKFCFANVDIAIEESDIQLSEDEVRRFVREFTSHVLNRLNTPRLAVRYGNALQFSLPIMKGEVNDVDLMLIEAIKIFFPQFYDFIKNNPDYFIGSYRSSFDNRINDDKIKKIKSKISILSENYSDTDKTGIQSLLQSIFPELSEVYRGYSFSYGGGNYNDCYNNKRVCSPRYFDRYFSYSLQEGEISDVEFERILTDLDTIVISDLSNRFKEVIDKGSVGDFMVKIRSREKQYTWEEAKKISKALALIGKKFPKIGSNLLFNADSHLSQAAIFIYHLINKGDNSELKVKLARELTELADTFEFAYEINRWLRGSKEEDDTFSVEEYQSIGKVLIERALKESKESPIFEVFERFSGYLFGVWSEIDKDEFLDYIKNILDRDSSKIINLIEACTPTSRSTGHPEPYKGNFDKDHYDWMNHVFDVEYLYEVLTIFKGKEVDVSDVKFGDRMYPNVSPENILKQFAYWHQKSNEGVE